MSLVNVNTIVKIIKSEEMYPLFYSYFKYRSSIENINTNNFNLDYQSLFEKDLNKYFMLKAIKYEIKIQTLKDLLYTECLTYFSRVFEVNLFDV